MKLTSLIFFGFLSIAVNASSTQKYLKVGPLTPVKISPGQSIEVKIPIVISPEYHIQANPAAAPQLIPTTVELTPAPGIDVSKARYPKGKPYRQQGTPVELSVYSGSFEVVVPLKSAPSAKPGPMRLSGKLRFQACNDKICFFPENVPLELNIQISKVP